MGYWPRRRWPNAVAALKRNTIRDLGSVCHGLLTPQWARTLLGNVRRSQLAGIGVSRAHREGANYSGFPGSEEDSAALPPIDHDPY